MGNAERIALAPWMPGTAFPVAMLVEQRSVMLISRLVLDASGQLQYGEAVDTEAQSQGRFVGWDSLTRNARAWLARQEHDSGADG